MVLTWGVDAPLEEIPALVIFALKHVFLEDWMLWFLWALLLDHIK